VHRAREHNLRDIEVTIPRDGMTVLTGVSGFRQVHARFRHHLRRGPAALPRVAECLRTAVRAAGVAAGRRRYLRHSADGRDRAAHQPGGRKSTVGTLTEVHHFLRLLYVKLGVQHCPDCQVPIEPQSADSIAALLLRDAKGRKLDLLAPLVVARKGYYTDLAKWALAKGYPELRVDGEMRPTRSGRGSIVSASTPSNYPSAPSRSGLQPSGRCVPRSTSRSSSARGSPHRRQGTNAGLLHAPGLSVLRPQLRRARSAHVLVQFEARLVRGLLRHRRADQRLRRGAVRRRSLVERLVRRRSHRVPGLHGPAAESGRPQRHVQGQVDRRIVGAAVDKALAFFDTLRLQGREAEIARDLQTEAKSRLAFLSDVGLGYLSLDRSAPTLSGGEAQRIRLAAQLGSNLQGVCYVLDEPTIGLHPRDNRILLDSLQKLAAKGNTLLVVEHDEETIRRADHLLDLGPGAGTRGGHVVGEGSVDDLIRSPLR
jgi:excinuclease ABC subunit A